MEQGGLWSLRLLKFASTDRPTVGHAVLRNRQISHVMASHGYTGVLARKEQVLHACLRRSSGINYSYCVGEGRIPYETLQVGLEH